MTTKKQITQESEGRARILTEALRCFAELGYEGTTTAGVARQAGVTQPLVHHHFGSKEGLWRAAVDQLFTELRLFTAIDPALPPADGLLGVVERFVRLSAARPELTRLLARESASPGPRLSYLVDHHLRAQYRAVVEALKAAQAAGTVDPSLRPELLVFLVTGAASHLFDLAALAKESLGVDTGAARTQDEFVALVLSVLRTGVIRKPVAKHK